MISAVPNRFKNRQNAPFIVLVFNESSPLSFISVNNIQLDGGHVGFYQDGGPIEF